MSLSPADYPANLDPSNPKGTDPGSILDDQDRNILQSIKQTFPNVAGAVTATHEQLDYVKNVGYGGIHLSTAAVPAPPLTITGVELVLDQYWDTNTVASPIDVVQNAAGGTLTIEPGIWLISVAFAGEVTASSEPDRSLFIRLGISGGGTFPMQSGVPVPVNGTSGGVAWTALIPRSTQTVLDLRAYTRPSGKTIVVTNIRSMEFNAIRVGEA